MCEEEEESGKDNARLNDLGNPWLEWTRSEGTE